MQKDNACHETKHAHRLQARVLVCRVTVKGAPDEEAVLCTSKATFALKHVETTNSLFIVPGPSQNGAAEDSNIVVAATADAHIELVPTAPRFAALDRVLEVSFMMCAAPSVVACMQRLQCTYQHFLAWT